ncbi:putative thiazole-containing bacteriocin maturation protein [Halobacillus sp. Marseille-Q1614]|uniref:putative thiazole-containing bacteriocin maturation protein n=1 Tax=Halobacillus sp. Marseille-Q1614 TaxID=2709134 RepID=UPI00156FFA0B|nr:putative thiazole-containing bacteriocin maturation protein [Halobacillus sp. Marseille-Q1614]
MANVRPSMRLKVKRGTFFMPESNGSVYFRNNSGSFRMEGSTIHQWVEKLIPMLNGEYSLASLTEGLPPLYRDRVYEITDALYTNGFLRDVSKDRPHVLKEHIVKKFSSQIEFLESFGDSAAYRFQQYREQKILAIGEGTMIIGLVSALLQSGMASFHTFITDREKTSCRRLLELEASAKKADPDVSIEVLFKDEKELISWEDQVEAFDAVVYVSQEGRIEELGSILHACQVKNKLFIPSICHGGFGIAGPFVSIDSSSCWESAWRSLPQDVLEDSQPSSSPAEAMLTNVIVFELFKKLAGVKEAHHTSHMYLLNMETLEGRWHPFKPHPLVTGKISAVRVDDALHEISKNEGKRDGKELLYYFSELTASPLGIFYRWDEDDLNQLPLSQCKIQVVDVKAEGPSALTTSLVTGAMSHEEARREAGLTGIEQYVKPLTNEILASLSSQMDGRQDLPATLHLGAGETVMEAVSRAVQKTIENEWKKQAQHGTENVSKIMLNKVNDKLCRYYWQALTTMKKIPELALGEDAFGFPVVWFKTEENHWRGCVGFNQAMALREALLLVLMHEQTKNTSILHQAASSSRLSFAEKPVEFIDIPAYESKDKSEVIRSVIKRLEENNKELSFVKVLLDSFESDGVINIYGVLVGEGEKK